VSLIGEAASRRRSTQCADRRTERELSDPPLSTTLSGDSRDSMRTIASIGRRAHVQLLRGGHPSRPACSSCQRTSAGGTRALVVTGIGRITEILAGADGSIRHAPATPGRRAAGSSSRWMERLIERSSLPYHHDGPLPRRQEGYTSNMSKPFYISIRGAAEAQIPAYLPGVSWNLLEPASYLIHAEHRLAW